MTRGDITLFALRGTQALGERVARELRIPLGALEERDFEDGEHKTRPLEAVRGRDVFVMHSLHGDDRQSPNDKLCRLLFFIGALRDAGATRVTAVLPYLCYARKDRRTKPRDPVTTRYVAALFEAVGVDGVLTIEVHNPAAFENAFRCRTYPLDAHRSLVRHFMENLGEADLTVVSPDAGGMKRAERFREALESSAGRDIGSAILEKKRSAGVVSGALLAGELKGRVAIIIDDLISTGTTLERTANACRAAGAAAVHAAATHGLFVGDAGAVFGRGSLDSIVVTDTVPPFRLDKNGRPERLAIISVAPLLAEAIRRLHSDGSLVELMMD